MSKVQLSVLMAAKNEEKNIKRCLMPLVDWADEIVLVDSQSTDNTIQIAEEFGVKVVQFYYKGGWPKKRQWMLENYKFKNEWLLILDADEIVTEKLKTEIGVAITNKYIDGYFLNFQFVFLGKPLKYSYPGLKKLALIKYKMGRYEKLLEDQDASMADMEVHEHMIVDGNISTLENSILHYDFNNLFRYIHKHNEYSNWEAKVFLEGLDNEIRPKLFGSKRNRRRWLKKRVLYNKFFPFIYFFYEYFIKLGFLDGREGFYYIAFKMNYYIEVNAKIFEIKKTGIK